MIDSAELAKESFFNDYGTRPVENLGISYKRLQEILKRKPHQKVLLLLANNPVKRSVIEYEDCEDCEEFPTAG